MNLTNRKLITLNILLLFPFLLIDMINGYFIASGSPIPLSAIYKLILIVCFSFPVIGSIQTLLAISFSILTISFQTLYFSGNFFFDFSSVAKSLIFFLMFNFFYVNRFWLSLKHKVLIEKVFVLNLIVLMLNIFSGLFGIGYSTYGGGHVSTGVGSGYKGFFYAGNEIGALLICFLPVIYRRYCIGNSRYFIFISVTLISAILLSTKTAILGTIIFISFTLISKYKFKTILVLPVLVFFAYLMHGQLINFVTLTTERLTYFLEQRGILFLIFSGRSEYIIDYFKYISENFDLMAFLFGWGPSYASGLFKSAEVDFFDLLVWQGLFWTLLFYIVMFIFSFYIFIYSRKLSCNEFSLTVIIIFFISNIAGHAYTSAMMLPFLSLYYPYVRSLNFNSDCKN
ncbi:O-antigen ligase family protein [Vibrio parahaemolyticus]|uniref:O-antigen ligase family protein n=1 Tax=Vibrio parahaemolyticus TaxID=670 RepID=UPI00111F55A8|nr:O-antigen ligase family protein [Vibrio parahaemolyticus]TOP31048.1 hypothetical protein CGH19_12740 [Vibrio parahaemolyticus]